MITRRHFGKLSIASLAALATPRGARAIPGVDERKFLVIYAAGGWDFSYVFAPLFDNSWVSVDENSTTAEFHGIPFVDAESRPSVRAFFEDHGDRTCILNGLELRSITHDWCRRLAFTGTSSTLSDDFASIIAAHSSADLLAPHTVVSGPAYTWRYASKVVRVGQNGQLPALLEGEHPSHSDQPLVAHAPYMENAVDDFVSKRVQEYAEQAGHGQAQRFGTTYAEVLGQLGELQEMSDQIDFASGELDLQAQNAINLLELGISRCATIEHKGLYDRGWDTHTYNGLQDSHFELLFQLLNTIMEELSLRTSLSGTALSEEVTVVVISEMGRDPRLNAQGGKHHWTYTSAMLIGSGVSGGQVIGAFDDYVTGSPVDLDSGGLSSGGVQLDHGHLGATLLGLADVDPGDYLYGIDPIWAAMR